MESNYTSSQHLNTDNDQYSPYTGPEAQQSRFQTGLSRQQTGFGSSPPPDDGSHGDPSSRYGDIQTQTMPCQNLFDPQNADFLSQHTSFTDGLLHHTGYGQSGHPQQQTESSLQYQPSDFSPGRQQSWDPQQQTDTGLQYPQSDFSPSRQQSWDPQQQTDTGLQYPQADIAPSRQSDLQENFEETQGLIMQPGYLHQQVIIPDFDFKDLHLPQLQRVCGRNGVNWHDQNGKPELICWLEMHGGAQVVLDYHELDLKQLKTLRKKRGMPPPDSKNRSKARLIQALHEYDLEAKSGADEK